MSSLVVLRYQLIEELRGDSNDHLRTTPSQFRDHIFWLLQRNYASVNIQDFIKQTQSNQKQFLIIIEGNYKANSQALYFLKELNIDTILFKFINTEELPNGKGDAMTHYNGLALMSISELNQLIRVNNNYRNIYLGDLPAHGKNLVTCDNLYHLVDEVINTSPYFNCFHEDGYNNAITRLVKSRDFKFMFTHDTGVNHLAEVLKNSYCIKTFPVNHETTAEEFDTMFKIESVQNKNKRLLGFLFQNLHKE